MKKRMTFEEALASLENIISKMEKGELTLDESLSSFEEAVGLVKLCNEELENAERRVRLLTEGEDGVMTDAPFDSDDET